MHLDHLTMLKEATEHGDVVVILNSDTWLQRHLGRYVTLDEGKKYKVKKFVIDPFKAISLQHHHHRTEYWFVAESTATILLDGNSQRLAPGDTIVVVKQGAHHKLVNNNNMPLMIMEIQSGDYMGEDDIVMLDPQI